MKISSKAEILSIFLFLLSLFLIVYSDSLLIRLLAIIASFLGGNLCFMSFAFEIEGI